MRCENCQRQLFPAVAKFLTSDGDEEYECLKCDWRYLKTADGKVHFLGLPDTKVDAVEDAGRRSTVGIVSGSGQVQWLGLGTGTLIRWRGRRLILTAAHVLDHTDPADLRFFLPLATPPKKTNRPTLRDQRIPKGALTPFTQLKLGGIVRDETLDLAAIIVDEPVEERSAAQCFDFVEGVKTPDVGALTVTVGYPHDIRRGSVAFSHTESAPIAPNRPRDGFDPSLHFLTQFIEVGEYPGASPKGMSGSARWFHKPIPEGQLWTSNIDIAGLTVTYTEDDQLLKSLRREVLERFLRERV